jgi:hypothetical protein
MRSLVIDTRSRFDKGIPGGVIAIVVVVLILTSASNPRSSCYVERAAPTTQEAPK